jgi:hypothetical protein
MPAAGVLQSATNQQRQTPGAQGMSHPSSPVGTSRLRVLVWLVVLAVATGVAATLNIFAPGAWLGTNSGPGHPGILDDDEMLALAARTLVGIFAFLPIVYVSGCFHELGHALLGRWSGFVVTTFGMGIGKPFFMRTWGGTRFYLARKAPFQGLTLFYHPELFPTRKQVIMFGLGGVLANALLVPAALLGWLVWPFDEGGFLWLLAGGINALFAVGNLVPIRCRIQSSVLYSDGALVLHVLRAGRFPATSGNTIALVALLRGLLEETGNRFMHTVYFLAAAGAWRSLGSVTRAEQCLAEATALAANDFPELDGLFALARATVSTAADRLDDAASALGQAEAFYTAQRHEAGQFYVSVYRAEYLNHKGEAFAAAAELEQLAAVPAVQHRPVVRLEWLVAQARVHAVLPSDDRVAALRAEYDALRLRFPSAERDLEVYRSMAVRAGGRDDWAAAAADFRRAVDAAKTIHRSLPGTEDRAHYLECQLRSLLEPARECFRRLGRSQEVDDIDSLIHQEPARQQDVAHDRGRLVLHVGLAVAMLDMFAVVVLVALFDFDRPRPRDGVDTALVVAMLCMILLVGAFAAALTFLHALLVPSSRLGNGRLTLAVAVIPWLLGSVLLALISAAAP